MKAKLPWLKDRLREIGKTPAALARELKVQPPRVYEMIGGRRAMQPNEIAPTARFLDWELDQLLAALPPDARVLPTEELKRTNSDDIPVLATVRDVPPPSGGNGKTKHLLPVSYDCVLTGETSHYVERLPAFEGRNDISCLYLHSVAMVPWRAPGELIVFEKARPPRESDHVVIWLACQDHRHPVVVRQLVQESRGKLRVRQHNPCREYDIERKLIAEVYRVMGWDDCLR